MDIVYYTEYSVVEYNLFFFYKAEPFGNSGERNCITGEKNCFTRGLHVVTKVYHIVGSLREVSIIYSYLRILLRLNLLLLFEWYEYL